MMDCDRSGYPFPNHQSEDQDQNPSIPVGRGDTDKCAWPLGNSMLYAKRAARYDKDCR